MTEIGICLCGRTLDDHILQLVNPPGIAEAPPPDCDEFELAYYVTEDGGIVQP